MKRRLSDPYVLLLIGGVLLSVARFLLAQVSAFPSDLGQVSAWLTQAQGWLIMADEILAFAIASSGVAIILLYQKLRTQFPTAAAVLLVTFALAVIGWVNVTLDIGRLVYPVNGVTPVVANGLVYLTQVYGTLHWSDLALGAATVSLAFMSQGKLLRYSGILVGALQVVGTYYGAGPNIWLISLCQLAWLMWLILWSVSGRKQLQI